MKENKCPVCGATTQDLRNGGERGISHHITNKAKTELWANYWDKKVPTPHLNYYKQNLKIGKVEIRYIFH